MNHFIALSGGKDSTALAFMLGEREPRDYRRFCTPTGDELPEWRRHMSVLAHRLGPIDEIGVDGGLDGCIEANNALPNHRMRFCTRQLKIEPARAFLAANVPCILYVALRADEPDRKGGIYGDIEGITVRYPLREWGIGLDDVLQTIDRLGLLVPERTDCARCFYQTLGEWWLLYKEHPGIYEQAAEQERRFGHTFRSDSRDTWPASLDDLRAEFERGRIPRGAPVNLSLFRPCPARVCSL